MSFSDLLIIIEPADLDTSMDVDPEMRVIDDRAERIAASFGLQRVMHYANDVPWNAYGSNDLMPVLIVQPSDPEPEPVEPIRFTYTDEPGPWSYTPLAASKPQRMRLTRFGLSVIREA